MIGIALRCIDSSALDCAAVMLECQTGHAYSSTARGRMTACAVEAQQIISADTWAFQLLQEMEARCRLWRDGVDMLSPLQVCRDVHSHATAWMSWRVLPACRSGWRTKAGSWELSRMLFTYIYWLSFHYYFLFTCVRCLCLHFSLHMCVCHVH